MFNRRRLNNLSDLLSTAPEVVSHGKRERLAEHADVLQRRHNISADRRAALEQDVSAYLTGTSEGGEDMHLAMLAVLFERYAKRVPQKGLFDQPEEDVEPNRPLTVDASIAEGPASICFTATIVPIISGSTLFATQVRRMRSSSYNWPLGSYPSRRPSSSRAKAPTLRSSVQHKLLRDRAAEMVRAWDFPQQQLVRRLADGIAKQCVVKSLEGNASLGGGATAFGIPQEEFDAIPSTYPDLARVLQFGVAYNAFGLVPDHGTKSGNGV